MLFFIDQNGKSQQVFVDEEMSKKALVHCFCEYKLYNLYGR